MRTAVVRIRTSAATFAWWLSLGVCLTALAGHFFLIEMSNLPQNAIGVRLRHQVSGYVHPLFAQNWNFFAPNPVDQDITVLARLQWCRHARCTISSWYEVSAPLVESVKRNRFSPLGLVQIMLDNAADTYHDAIATSADAYVKGQMRRHMLLRELPYRVDPVAAEIMLRTSVAELAAKHLRLDASRIQIGLYVYRFPRFSKSRELDRPERDGAIFPLEWKPLPRHVSPFVRRPELT